MSGGGYDLLEAALAVSRTRSSWNNWLSSAEEPASDHEEQKIERAASMATLIVNSNKLLTVEKATVIPQGSYYNNTNARFEADMDLRVQLPGLRTIYLNGMTAQQHGAALGYSSTGRDFADIVRDVRDALGNDLIKKFGTANVNLSGKKSIKVSGLSGSRADCDLVPAFELHVITGDSKHPGVVKGSFICGTDGSHTLNFPDQHHANGVAKRSRTSHRFKRNVRMLKRLNYDLTAIGEIPERMPSFLIECLVYRVEDDHFLVESDDRYLRLLRILQRLSVLLDSPEWVRNAHEINDIKYLFHESQGWSVTQARCFVAAALRRLDV